jgi:hypothetical protein
MAQLTECVKEYLPTPWSRRVAISSLTLATAILFLPEWWPNIGMPPIGQETLLPRLFVVSTILFLGSLITLALVIRSYHAQAAKHLEELAAERKKHKSKISLKNFKRLSGPIKYDDSGIV